MRFYEKLNIIPVEVTGRAFLLYAPISIISVPVALGADSQFGNLAKKLILAFLVTITTGIFYLGTLSLLRLRFEKIDIMQAILIIATTGIFRGVIFYWLISLTSFEQPTSLILRTFNSLSNTMLWLSLAIIMLSVRRNYRQRYRTQLMQLLLSNVVKDNHFDPGFAAIAQELAVMRGSLKRVHGEVSLEPTNISAMKRASDEIQFQIDEALRPLSHRLWVSSIYEFPRIRFGALFSFVMENLKYPFAILILTYSTTSFVNLIANTPIRDAMEKSLASISTLIALEALRRIFSKKLAHLAKLVNGIFLLTVGVATTLTSTLVARSDSFSQIIPTVLLFSPCISAIIMILAAVRISFSDRRKFLERLVEQSSDRRAESMKSVGFNQAQIASYLHNSLQSELNAISRKLSDLAITPSEAESLRVLEQLEALLNRSMSEDFANYIEDPQTRFRKVIDSWRGIADFEIEVASEIFADPIRNVVFLQFIEEAIANSVRHGGANWMRIQGFYSHGDFKTEIQDNGSLISGHASGLGTSWLAGVSIESASLETVGEKTILKVTF